jgi:hypothetical protein
MPTTLPSLEEFASATVDVLSQTPIEAYVPVFVFESEVIGLEEIPEGIADVEALQDHAERSGWQQLEFLFGVRSAKDIVTIGHHDVSGARFIEIRWERTGWEDRPVGRPSWWRLAS